MPSHRIRRFRFLCPPLAGVTAKRPGVDNSGLAMAIGHEKVDHVDCMGTVAALK
ncbi:MAG TPA: hypothetical protein PLD73_03615 [Candidatus Hydrogenedentes bacterium]|nr:hypothetical protein [Candidatus Hydrogenedentota bacterium]